MKFLTILLLATILVSVYGSKRVGNLVKKANDRNVVRLFNKAATEGYGPAFVEALLYSEGHKILKIIGLKAYQVIPINEKSVETLVKANDPWMFTEFFRAHILNGDGIIVKHLISLKAWDTLKAIGEDAYKLIPLEKEPVKALAEAEDPEMFKGFFRAHLYNSKDILKHLISLKDWTTLGAVWHYAVDVPLDKELVKGLVEAGSSEPFRNFFMYCTKITEYRKILECLVSSKAWSILEDIAKDADESIAADKESIGILVKAGNPELFKKFYNAYDEFLRSGIVKYLISLKAWNTLKAIGEDAYKRIPLNEEPVKALAEAKDSEMFMDFMKSRTESLDREKIVKYLISFKAWDILKAIGDPAYQLIFINKEKVKALVEGGDTELFRGIFMSREPNDRDFMAEELVLLKAYSTLKSIGEKISGHLPLNKGSVRALVEIDDFNIAKSFYERVIGGELPSLLTPTLFFRELMRLGAYAKFKAISGDADRMISTYTKKMEASVEVADPEAFEAFFASSAPYIRMPIVENLMLKKDTITLKGIGREAYQLVPINRESVKTFVEADDSEMFRDFFMSRNTHYRAQIIEELIDLKACHTLRDISGEVSRYLPFTKESVQILVMIDDFNIAKGFYERLPERDIDTLTKEEFFEELRSLNAYDKFKAVERDVYQLAFLDEEFVQLLVEADGLKAFKDFFMSCDLDIREIIVKDLKLLKADTILKVIEGDAHQLAFLDEEFVQLLVEADDLKAFKDFFMSCDLDIRELIVKDLVLLKAETVLKVIGEDVHQLIPIKEE